MQVGKVVRWLRLHQLCNHEDWSLDLSTHIKTQMQPRSEKARSERIAGVCWLLAYVRKCEPQIQRETLSQMNRQCNRKGTHTCSLVSVSVHRHAYLHIHSRHTKHMHKNKYYKKHKETKRLQKRISNQGQKNDRKMFWKIWKV